MLGLYAKALTSAQQSNSLFRSLQWPVDDWMCQKLRDWIENDSEHTPIFCVEGQAWTKREKALTCPINQSDRIVNESFDLNFDCQHTNLVLPLLKNLAWLQEVDPSNEL